jgi:hypothetical protein
MTTSESPQEIYEAALRERKSKNPLKRREACEKGWLAVVEAVDNYLALNGLHIHKGKPEAHSERKEFLTKLAFKDMTTRRIARLVAEVTDYLHGTCFYEGKDSEYMTIVLNETVKEILELTGNGNGNGARVE